MPTLRIQFPEKDTPSTVSLSGNRITVGRRADNTVQIVDRMISAFHAELILEGDHYRLHDLGSTNGTRVNGEIVDDFHLREACKIGFGPVECEFSPETAVQDAETLPTRIEVDAVRKENETLKGRISVLEEEVASFRKVQEAPAAEGEDLTRAELQRMIQERAELQESAQKQTRDFTALKTELARMNRDRQNLQDALSQAQAELAHLREQSAAAKAAEQPKPSAPAAAPTAVPTATVASPKAVPAPSSAPAAPSKPAVAPASLPKPTSVGGVPAPSAPSAPSVPTPTARPAVPAGQPAAPSAPGLRPVARPAVAAQTPGAPRAVPTPTATPRPAAGPSGTQKINVPASGQPVATPAQGVKPVAKPTGLPKLGSVPKPVAVPAAKTDAAGE